MTSAEWFSTVSAFVGIAGVIIAFLSWKDDHGKLKNAGKNIKSSYKNERLRLLLNNIHDLDADETIELMLKLQVIIQEGNGRTKDAMLLLEYLKNKHDLE